jgi:hypothetical protein
MINEMKDDKNLLFDGKSLWEKKDPVKEKNKAKGRETREASEGKGARADRDGRKGPGSQAPFCLSPCWL